MTEQQPRGPEQAAQRLAADSAELVHAELQHIRTDALELARRSAGGLALAAIAGAGAALALHAFASAVLRGADRLLPPRAAALTLTGVYLAGSAGAAVLATQRLRAAAAVAGRAASDLRTDAEAAVGTDERDG
ncbi:phage holin family protein [Actinocatenispora comari]|uniref:Phage holin family protein n=1 Tax=Actinocatenispora comari TaxID=2807577 RepID=A0A8J4ABE4_9ACTN|nr:phage holin family protein [Actinocatenispora comari]GIL27808.1 hypothetical protein NUM_30620 [Actinocatenispora comari]